MSKTSYSTISTGIYGTNDIRLYSARNKSRLQSLCNRVASVITTNYAKSIAKLRHSTKNGAHTSKKWRLPRLLTARHVVLATHLTAIVAALTIISINIVGKWVGKELTGKVNNDGEKRLALQLTSKLHELVMLASLSDVLFTNILGQLTSRFELPLATITAGLEFRNVSFFWSKEFVAICTSRYSKKGFILPLVVVATILGLIVGPSSATAMVPRFDDWLVGDVAFALDQSAQELWPSTLRDTNDATINCEVQDQSCNMFETWDVLAKNLFSYWGRSAIGNILEMPEKVNVPGRSSLRSMNVRFKGGLSMYQPEFTVATVQTGAIADTVRALRAIWFRGNSGRCFSGKSRRYCSYQDITWSVEALQPVVYTACEQDIRNNSAMFPIIEHLTPKPQTAEQLIDVVNDKSIPGTQLHWITLDPKVFSGASIGVIVSLDAANQLGQTSAYACTVKAEWANSTTKTSFLQLAYVVDGVPPYYIIPKDTGSTYEGRHVNLTPEWATQVFLYNSTIQANLTAFDTLLAAGRQTSNSLGAKVEAILAVLIAESMAQTGANANISGKLENSDDVLQRNGDAVHFDEPSEKAGVWRMQTVITGYAYGMRTASAFSISTLLSILGLALYVVIAIPHLTMMLISNSHMYEWRNVMDLMALALQSKPNINLRDSSHGIKYLSTLKVPIEIESNGNDAQIIIASGYEAANPSPSQSRP